MRTLPAVGPPPVLQLAGGFPRFGINGGARRCFFPLPRRGFIATMRHRRGHDGSEPPMDTPGSLASSKPEAVGLSAARLARLTGALSADIERKLLPGAVALIARRGRIAYLETLGLRDPATGSAMREDTIFRIYSMTKPIVSVAVMMLVEDGQVKLADPVAKFLPPFAGPKVAVERDGTVDLVP